MTKPSDETKKNRTLSIFFLVMSYVILYGPLSYYIISGLVVAGTASRVTLTLLAVSALIICVISFVQKYRLRSPLWLVIIGIFFAVENILPLIIMMAAGTVLDELLLTPLHKYYKKKAQINSEIDKRI